MGLIENVFLRYCEQLADIAEKALLRCDRLSLQGTIDSKEIIDARWEAAKILDLAREQRALRLANAGVDTARTPVGNNAFEIQRAEIGAGGNVAVLQINAKTERLDDAAPDFVF